MYKHTLTLVIIAISIATVFAQSQTENYISVKEPLEAATNIKEGSSNLPVSITLSTAVSTAQTQEAQELITLKPGFTANGSNGTFIAKIVPAEKTPVLHNIAYFDGLGRSMQNVAVAQSPAEKDLIIHIEYDEYGRQAREYLPYAHSTQNTGAYRSAAQTETMNYYAAGVSSTKALPADAAPYAEKLIEASPLNRVLKQGAPGTTWQPQPAGTDDHTIEIDYQTNTTNEVLRFDVGGTDAAPALIKNTNAYAPGQLYKTVTYDENNNSKEKKHSTEEYKDKQGRVVLKRTYGTVGSSSVAEMHDTYYVYDDYGNLTYVLPPKINTADGVSATELSELGYQYKYDSRNRMIEKKLPGKGWENIIYDRQDRVVLTQDPNLNANKQWLYTKYDKYGRVLYIGIYTDPNTTPKTRSQLQTTVYNKGTNNEKRGSATISGTAISYTNSYGYPTTNITLLTVSYYDDYTFSDPNKPATPTTVEGQAVRNGTGGNTKGLPTASWVKTLGATTWTKTYTYYDHQGRPVRTYTKNHLGGYTQTDSKLDFRGKPETTITRHKRTAAGSEIKTTDLYTYDHAERLLTQTQQTGTQTPEQIVQNTYDATGQLAQKQVGGALQTINYTYNIRGWLTAINDVNNIGTGLFAMSLQYNDAPAANRQYNGNIGQIQWKTANTDNSLKTYSYTYDALNRITAAIDNTGNYNVSGFSYDKNGNILSLQRQGHIKENATSFGLMDNLIYTYDSGNKLTKVLDNGNDTYGYKDGTNQTTEYIYDSNGNMTQDRNKGITNIDYNYLNLPEQITIGGQTIQYVYDAAGTKLQKIVNGVTTDYLDGYQYQNGSLQFFPHAEGYVSNESGTYKYIYNHTDHLGNVRLSYTQTASSLQILEENNYYPFGLKHKGYNNAIQGSASAYNYKYNGKEMQEELGLDWYDYGARMYDPVLGRFTTVDPHSENYYGWTLYNYVANNPLLLIDPDGKDWFVNGETGSVLYVEGVSELTEDHIKEFGEGWNHFGDDFVFGEEVFVEGEEGNVLVNIDLLLDPEAAESFMKTQGYEKGEKYNIVQQTTEAMGDDDGSLSVHTFEQIGKPSINGESIITYIDSKNFNKEDNVKYSEFKDGNLKINTRTYDTVVPYGQNPPGNNTKKKRSNVNKTNKVLKIIKNIIDAIL